MYKKYWLRSSYTKTTHNIATTLNEITVMWKKTGLKFFYYGDDDGTRK